nr:hypothetical protein [Enterococcus sp.]
RDNVEKILSDARKGIPGGMEALIQSLRYNSLTDPVYTGNVAREIVNRSVDPVNRFNKAAASLCLAYAERSSNLRASEQHVCEALTLARNRGNTIKEWHSSRVLLPKIFFADRIEKVRTKVPIFVLTFHFRTTKSDVIELYRIF